MSLHIYFVTADPGAWSSTAQSCGERSYQLRLTGFGEAGVDLHGFKTAQQVILLGESILREGRRLKASEVVEVPIEVDGGGYRTRVVPTGEA